MTRNGFRRGVGALLLAVTLGLPGIAVAETASLDLSATGLGTALWDFFTGIFLEDETTSSDGSGTGGDTNNGGGAMDPNGGGKGETPPPPYP